MRYVADATRYIYLVASVGCLLPAGRDVDLRPSATPFSPPWKSGPFRAAFGDGSGCGLQPPWSCSCATPRTVHEGLKPMTPKKTLDAALEAPLFHGTPDVLGDACFLDRESSTYTLCSTACATVEERPFEGRVRRRARTRASAPVVVFLCGSENGSRGLKPTDPKGR
jgi:hypothetical protein